MLTPGGPVQGRRAPLCMGIDISLRAPHNENRMGKAGSQDRQ